MSGCPQIRELKNGEYQVELPIPGHPMPHIVRNDFSSEENAQRWIESDDGKTVIQQIKDRYFNR
jgi:hypothetical protein